MCTFKYVILRKNSRYNEPRSNDSDLVDDIVTNQRAPAGE